MKPFTFPALGDPSDAPHPVRLSKPSIADLIRGRRDEVPANLAPAEAIEYVKAHAEYQHCSDGSPARVIGVLLILAGIVGFSSLLLAVPGALFVIMGCFVFARGNRQHREFLRAQAVYRTMKALTQ